MNITKSNIKRREFVKRSGGISLGTVLGLGIIPSVMRKLDAQDMSTPGTTVKWTSALTSGNRMAIGWIASQHYEDNSFVEQDLALVPLDYTDGFGKTYLMTVYRMVEANALKNNCVPSLRIDVTLAIYVQVKQTVFGQVTVYDNTFHCRRSHTYECYGGGLHTTETIYRDDAPLWNGDLIHQVFPEKRSGSPDADAHYPSGAANHSWIDVDDDLTHVRLKNPDAEGTWIALPGFGYSAMCC